MDPDNAFSPQFLSDGLHVIYSVPARSAIGLARLDGGPSRTLMTLATGTSEVRYSSGYVFFVQDGTLFARPFNERRLEFTGDANASSMAFLGPSGSHAVLSLRCRRSRVPDEPFGRSRGAPLVRAEWTVVIGGCHAGDIPWVYLVARRPTNHWLPHRQNRWRRSVAAQSRGGTDKQITFRQRGIHAVVVTRRDTHRVFRVPGASAAEAVHQGPEGRGAPSPVGESPLAAFASGWTPDGREIVIVRLPDPSSLTDLWRHRLDGGAIERLWFNTPANELQGTVSPDGRWIVVRDGSIRNGGSVDRQLPDWHVQATDFARRGRFSAMGGERAVLPVTGPPADGRAGNRWRSRRPSCRSPGALRGATPCRQRPTESCGIAPVRRRKGRPALPRRGTGAGSTRAAPHRRCQLAGLAEPLENARQRQPVEARAPLGAVPHRIRIGSSGGPRARRSR